MNKKTKNSNFKSSLIAFISGFFGDSSGKSTKVSKANTNSLFDPQKIIYGKFNERILASLIDLLLAAILFFPLVYLMREALYGGATPSFVMNEVIKQFTDLHKEDPGANWMSFLKNNQLLNQYFFINHGWMKMLFDQLFQITCLAVTIFFLWNKIQTTPGKAVFGLKIIDAKTFGAPSKLQYLVRFLGYFLGIGIFWVIFDSKNQALHDKISGTLVVKKS